MFADLLRYFIFAEFAGGVAMMFCTNYLAFRVLRPPQRLGFLWWHVTTVSVSFICLGIVAIDSVLGRLGEGVSWRTLVTVFGSTTFLVSQILIFGVERSRLARKSAHAQQDLPEVPFDAVR